MKRLRFALHVGGALEEWHRACLELLDAYAEIADSELDFVLQLGRGKPSSEAPAARFGVWRFAHMTEDEPLATAALLRTDTRGNAMVIEEGHFRVDRRSAAASRNRIEQALASWPARVCQRLLAGLDVDRGPFTAPPSPKPPSRARSSASVIRRRLALAWERLFRHPQWNVGVLRMPIGELASSWSFGDADVEWFPLDRQGFLADPFGVVRDGRLRILCERFDYRTGAGRICALEHSGRFEPEQKQVSFLTGHVSYPFLVEDAGEIYCVPETCEANEVALYRAKGFPERWSKAGVLLDDFPGVDPTLFSHEGRWWLFCTRHGPYEDEELWAWHADAIGGPWTPHARNPIKTDVRGARPAGTPFVLDGALHRPAQDCSRSYGGRVAMHRVRELTPTEFDEEQVATIEAPADGRFALGIHTLTPLGDVVLIDGRRAIFSWPAFRAFVAIWMRDLRQKLSRSPNE